MITVTRDVAVQRHANTVAYQRRPIAANCDRPVQIGAPAVDISTTFGSLPIGRFIMRSPAQNTLHSLGVAILVVSRRWRVFALPSDQESEVLPHHAMRFQLIRTVGVPDTWYQPGNCIDDIQPPISGKTASDDLDHAHSFIARNGFGGEQEHVALSVHLQPHVFCHAPAAADADTGSHLRNASPNSIRLFTRDARGAFFRAHDRWEVLHHGPFQARLSTMRLIADPAERTERPCPFASIGARSSKHRATRSRQRCVATTIPCAVQKLFDLAARRCLRPARFCEEHIVLFPQSTLDAVLDTSAKFGSIGLTDARCHVDLEVTRVDQAIARHVDHKRDGRFRDRVGHGAGKPTVNGPTVVCCGHGATWSPRLRMPTRPSCGLANVAVELARIDRARRRSRYRPRHRRGSSWRGDNIASIWSRALFKPGDIGA